MRGLLCTSVQSAVLYSHGCDLALDEKGFEQENISNSGLRKRLDELACGFP